MGSPATAPSRQRRTSIVGGLLVAAILGVLAVVLLGGDAPAAVTIDDAVGGLEDASRPPDGSSRDHEGAAGEQPSPTDAAATAGSSDGSWSVSTEVEPYDLASSSGSFVGYRIDEELANVGATQAVGRTPAVSGGVSVDGTSVTELVIEGDLTALVSDRTQRDGRVATALDTATHPTVRFTGQPFELPAPLADGDRIEVAVPGTLEVAGGSSEVTATVTAQRSGDVVVATGSLDLPLADVGITPPSASVVLSVADTATLEWQLYLTRR